jgi:hypothetical protein
MNLKPGVPSRNASEVGPGDFVKTGTGWQRIDSITAIGECQPRTLVVHTVGGRTYGPLGVERYARAEDLE